jgi:hypothetical protein
MGSYAHLAIAGRSFLESKSYVDSTLMTLFDDGDKRSYVRKVCERNPGIYGESDDDTDETAYEYIACAGHIKRRLDMLGFTCKRVRTAFAQRIAEYRELASEDNYFSLPMEGVDPEAFLSDYTFDVWAAGFQEFLTSGVSLCVDDDTKGRLSPVQQLIFNYPNDYFHYGFPDYDARLFVRGVVEVVDFDLPVVMDYSELVDAGYYDGSENLAAMAKSAVAAEFVSTAKLIVLTEGSTDSQFLRRSMELLRPHLAPLLSFVDFSVPNMEGGAANLIRVLKGFIGAGVANRVLAVFDNDAAGSDAMRGLNTIGLPPNVAAIQLPAVPYATSYPTIGPQGQSEMDVNGLAGAIELYFGLDILCRPNQSLTPVEWGGYVAAVGKYQGALQDKSRLQSAFARKLDDYASGIRSADHDWSGVNLMLDAVCQAFSEMASTSIRPTRSPWL